MKWEMFQTASSGCASALIEWGAKPHEAAVLGHHEQIAHRDVSWLPNIFGEKRQTREKRATYLPPTEELTHSATFHTHLRRRNLRVAK